MAQVGGTPYNNVREIKPGNYMIYDLTNKILSGYEYFSPRNLVNEDEYINIINTNINNSLRLQTMNKQLS